ncbi:MAG: BlaI/MecI/CopY family transcriptional regulator [Bacteroidota bacterium]
MKQLTKPQEQIMNVLWAIQKGFIKDIIDQLPPPKPAYNTVSTVIRVLEKKGYVGHTQYGNTYEYFPLVDQKDYGSFYLNDFLKSHFGGSFQKLLSFFANENNLSSQQVDEMIDYIEKNLKPKSNDDKPA